MSRVENQLYARPHYDAAESQRQAGAQAAPLGLTNHDEEWRQRARVAEAIQTLTRAKVIRADAALMADVRVYLQKQRDDLGDMLDDIA